VTPRAAGLFTVAAMEHLIHESEFHRVSAELPKFVKALADPAVADGMSRAATVTRR
jgi:hypothetical protein